MRRKHMDASSELDLHQLMEDVPVASIVREMISRCRWYASRPGVLPKHAAYWTECANTLHATSFLLPKGDA
jgi:hypothetical protein